MLALMKAPLLLFPLEMEWPKLYKTVSPDSNITFVLSFSHTFSPDEGHMANKQEPWPACPEFPQRPLEYWV